MLLVEASCNLRLDSSSTSASIFVEERQLSRLRRPSIPWRAIVFSSNSKAGPSRSMVRGRWHTGHSGCERTGQFDWEDKTWKYLPNRPGLPLDTAWYILYQIRADIGSEWHPQRCHYKCGRQWLPALAHYQTSLRSSCSSKQGLDDRPFVSCAWACTWLVTHPTWTVTKRDDSQTEDVGVV